ncbi:MAG: hypothetical protein NWE89_12345 [Candidatus Bathyarchaeota archaeon]|nr:hypothetical protein [Candidatus Bathyarchaeota archaeon]
MNDKTRIALEALITEREGMMAKNAQRAYLGQAMAYVDKDFYLLADRMQKLAREEKKMPASPKRIMAELEFISVEERFPTEEHVVFVITAEGSKPQRAYWQKRVVEGIPTLAAKTLLTGQRFRK